MQKPQSINQNLNNILHQQQKWNKLEHKYNQYILLLKKKLNRAQSKLSIMSKSSTVQHTNHSIQKTYKLNNYLDGYYRQILFSAFSKIKLKRFEDMNINKQNVEQMNEILNNRNNYEQIRDRFKELSIKMDKRSRRINNLKMMSLLIDRISKQKRKQNIRYSLNKLNKKGINLEVMNIFKKLQNRYRLMMGMCFNNIRLSVCGQQRRGQSIMDRLKYLKNIMNMGWDNKCNKDEQYMNIRCQNWRLKRQIQNLMIKNEQNKINIIKCNEQRQKDIIKKSQGLQLLADELRQKDQLIDQYQRQLKVLRTIGQTQSYLQISYKDYQIQKNKLQTINNRLNQQIKFKQSYHQHQYHQLTTQIHLLKNTLIQYQTYHRKLQTQNQLLKQYQFENQYQKQHLITLKQHLSSLSKQIYHKQSLYLNHLFHKNQHTSNLSFLQLIQSQIIHNIHQLLINHQSPSFYHPQSISIIQNIKSQLQQQYKDIYKYNPTPIIRIPSKNKGIHQLQCLDQVQYINKQGMQSIYEALQKSKYSDYDQIIEKQLIQNCRVQQMNKYKKEMQLLEYEKKKKQQELLGLKQRLMHIRIVVLQFLKSLDINNKISKQSKDIVNLLFQIFQYSQNQKKQILAKKNTSFFAQFI